MTYGSGNSGDYKKLKGQMIQVTDTDPLTYAGSWATGANINTARKGLSGFGTSPAAIAATGNSPSTVANCESWNGSAWSEVSDVNTAKFYRGNCGTQAAGLIIGGAPGTGDVEEWDNSSWTETANYPGNITGPILLGIQTAAFCIGGDVPPYTTATNTYNGSAFTGSTAINTARSTAIGSGTTTAAVIAGGTTPSATAATELWNGSAWTEVNELNTARELYGGSGDSSTGLIGFGGLATAVANTEDWNGTSWTEVGDLNTGRRELGGSTNGTSQLGLAFSGCIANGTVSSSTEEWSFPSAPGVQEGQLWIKTASGVSSVMKGHQAQGTGAWASGGSLNTARGFLTGAGTQTAALAMSGYEGPPGQPSVHVESYDGTSWTEIAEVNVARLEVGAFGSQTAANFVGGYAPTAPGRVSSNESWNGTSWTEVTNMPATTDNLMQGAGTSTAGMIVGGQTAPGAGNKTTNNVFYDGTNWTQAASLNAAKTLHATMGNQTSAIVASGLTGSPTASTVNVEQWNGTAWTEVANVSQARYRLVGAGTGEDAIVFAGTDFPSTTFYTLTESWNGSSWTEIGDMTTGREGGASTNSGTGNSRSALLAGGSLGSPVTAVTEEWTVPFVTKTIGTD